MKLKNVMKGYAEVIFSGKDEKDFKWFVLRRMEITTSVDFENDTIDFVYRWFIEEYHPMVFKGGKCDTDPWAPVGRITGYDTRKNAIEACKQFVRNAYGESYL